MPNVIIEAATRHAHQLLAQNNPAHRLLWIADENSAVPHSVLQALPNTCVLTNRFDIYAPLNAISEHINLSDFDLSEYASLGITHIIYSVSKEKAVTHHIINQAYDLLPYQGQLYLCGAKQQGAKTYIDKAAHLFTQSKCNTLEKLAKGKNASFAATLTKSQHQASGNPTYLDDRQYSEYTPIYTLGDTSILSKQGIFGWNKIDVGSALLIQHSRDAIKSRHAMRTDANEPANILDLGCGYGYLSLQLYHDHPALQQAHFHLTDNNIVAINCARRNCQAMGIDATLSADNCASKQRHESFDIILCNPPFHTGFAVDSDLTEQFVKQASCLLKKGGVAFFVVNQFIPLEKVAVRFFSRVTEIAHDSGFKVFQLTL